MFLYAPFSDYIYKKNASNCDITIENIYNSYSSVFDNSQSDVLVRIDNPPYYIKIACCLNVRLLKIKLSFVYL